MPGTVDISNISFSHLYNKINNVPNHNGTDPISFNSFRSMIVPSSVGVAPLTAIQDFTFDVVDAAGLSNLLFFTGGGIFEPYASGLENKKQRIFTAAVNMTQTTYKWDVLGGDPSYNYVSNNGVGYNGVHNSYSLIRLQNPDSLSIGINWKISSEANYDFLHVHYCDDDILTYQGLSDLSGTAFSASGETGSVTGVITDISFQHIIISYLKDTSTDKGVDKAYVKFGVGGPEGVTTYGSVILADGGLVPRTFVDGVTVLNGDISLNSITDGEIFAPHSSFRFGNYSANHSDLPTWNSTDADGDITFDAGEGNTWRIDLGSFDFPKAGNTNMYGQLSLKSKANLSDSFAPVSINGLINTRGTFHDPDTASDEDTWRTPGETLSTSGGAYSEASNTPSKIKIWTITITNQTVTWSVGMAVTQSGTYATGTIAVAVQGVATTTVIIESSTVHTFDDTANLVIVGGTDISAPTITNVNFKYHYNGTGYVIPSNNSLAGGWDSRVTSPYNYGEEDFEVSDGTVFTNANPIIDINDRYLQFTYKNNIDITHNHAGTFTGWTFTLQVRRGGADYSNYYTSGLAYPSINIFDDFRGRTKGVNPTLKITQANGIDSSNNTNIYSNADTLYLHFDASMSLYDFSLNDITVSNGSTIDLSSTYIGLTGTSNFILGSIDKPASTASQSIIIDVSSNTFKNQYGNWNIRGTPFTWYYNGEALTVTITCNLGSNNVRVKYPETSEGILTFSFSKDVSNFIIGDITPTNGSLSAFTTIDAATYSVKVAPSLSYPDGTTVKVDAGSVTDTYGNTNLETPFVIYFDNVRPTVAITITGVSNGGDTDLSNKIVTFETSEIPTGFDINSVAVMYGTDVVLLSGFSGSGTTYTTTLTDISAGTYTIDIADAEFTDSVGNTNIVAPQFSFVSSSGIPAGGYLMDGTGGTVRLKYPVYGYYDFSQTGTIYTGTEIATITGSSGNGTISAIKYDFAGWATPYQLNTQKIYISHVDSTTLGTATLTPDYAGSTLTDKTLVYADNVTISANGWKTLSFSTNFAYTGGKNILISWENRDSTYSSGWGGARGDTTTGKSRLWYKDNSYPTATAAYSEQRPNIELVFI